MADTSRIPGFYKDPLATRRDRLAAARALTAETRAHLERGGGLDPAVADRMSENVVACHGLPLSVGLNFLVNGRDLLVPMSVEEPSVVAAASNAARMVRAAGGFVGEATAPIMTAQVQLDEVPDPAGAAARVAARRAEILAAGDAAIPGMLARGGGCRDLETRALEDGIVVVHLYVDVGDAMGANVVDAVAEGAAAAIQAALGGRIGLRILSNLPVRRMVRVRAHAPDDAVGGAELSAGIARASRFAEVDVYRAATHNKGVMNGVDAVALALGQDWRALEAGAHAFAALSGRYRPLATWRRVAGGVDGTLEMPLAAATAGGSTRAHPGVRAAFDLLGVTGARELAVVMGAVGLASNLAALRALAGEGIQRGHMKLHERKKEIE
ncbi:MAG TPA: hydroxymethylglutaryl-CoA reductase, degradative [Haliangiales bacterium]|nr:hydroxymethylglutaryl-CoA reductase, degradative [Haliangiales bacterium]